MPLALTQKSFSSASPLPQRASSKRPMVRSTSRLMYMQNPMAVGMSTRTPALDLLHSASSSATSKPAGMSLSTCGSGSERIVAR